MNRLSKMLKVLFITATLFFTACISTGDFSNIVKSKLGVYVQLPESKQVDNVIIKTDKLHFIDSAVVVRKQKSYF